MACFTGAAVTLSGENDGSLIGSGLHPKNL
jgi:hypothetical protein